jgi:hypothetical protein
MPRIAEKVSRMKTSQGKHNSRLNAGRPVVPLTSGTAPVRSERSHVTSSRNETAAWQVCLERLTVLRLAAVEEFNAWRSVMRCDGKKKQQMIIQNPEHIVLEMRLLNIALAVALKPSRIA